MLAAAVEPTLKAPFIKAVVPSNVKFDSTSISVLELSQVNKPLFVVPLISSPILTVAVVPPDVTAVKGLKKKNY